MDRPATIDFARATARAQWGYASPYRVGLAVGHLALTASNPYRPGSRGAKNFAEGVAYATKCREAGEAAG